MKVYENCPFYVHPFLLFILKKEPPTAPSHCLRGFATANCQRPGGKHCAFYIEFKSIQKERLRTEQMFENRSEYFLNNRFILLITYENNAPIQESRSRSNTYIIVSFGAIASHLAGKDVAGGRMKAKIDYFDLITKATMWILGIAAIYMLLLKITGHSPTIEAILLTLVSILIAGMLNLYYHFGEINNFINHTFPRFENNIKESFEKVKKDSQELKEEFKKIREGLTEIKRKK